MLQSIRHYTQGKTAKVVIGLIVISFAGFGIESILLEGSGNEIAVVNGEKIQPQELQVAVENQKRRIFAMYGDTVDPAMLEDERLKSRTLEVLINRRLLLQASQAMGLASTERELGAVISNMEQFQVDGVFSPELYKQLLSQAGYTPASYKLSLGEDLVLNQVSDGLAMSEFATPTELEQSARVISEQRDFRYLIIPREKFSAESKATEQQIEAYYKEHLEEFRTPESVDLEYIDLTPADFFQPVEEDRLLEAFEVAKQDIQYQTQYRVSHVLFEPHGDISVKKRIALAQSQLSSGVSFMEVAKEFSDDPGSAVKGGDLGFTVGDTFPKAIEEAIQSLEPGIVSEPIETDAGTHLLMVTEKRSANEPSFEEMRADLEQEIQLNEARAELLRIVEELKDIAFNADDLVRPAKELGLQVERQKSVTRNNAKGLFATPELVEAAFSEEVFNDGHNSDVIELSGDRFVVLRVVEHSASGIQPLESVWDSIVPIVESNLIDAALVAEADEILTKMRSGEKMAEFVAKRDYEMVEELAVSRADSRIPQDILAHVFQLPTATHDSTSNDVLSIPGDDAIVLELDRVIPGVYTELAENERQNLRRSLTAEMGGLVFQEYQRRLVEQADINIL